MKKATDTLLKILLLAMLVYGLVACQPDTAIELADRTAAQQYVQSEEIRAMRAKAMAGIQRRNKLRSEAMQIADSVNVLTWFILGTDHPNYSKLPFMGKEPPVRSNVNIFKFLDYVQ